MKTLGTLLLFVFGAVSAPAQVVLDYSPVYLQYAYSYTATISSVGTGTTGTLVSVGCTRNATTLSGSITGTLDVTLDNVHKTSYSLYSSADYWSPDITPFVTIYNAWGYGNNAGGNPWDTFLLPLNVAYTNGLTVSIHYSATMGTSGTLLCSVLHT